MMIFMQGIMWLLSTIIHVLAVKPLENSVNAKIALANGIGVTDYCQCDICLLPENEVDRAKAEQMCKLRCADKCPPRA